jgi:thioredoxin reductase
MADFKVTELDENLDFSQLAYWDVVIIGAGPAGLAASLTTAHRGLTTLVLEAKDRAGGQPQFLYPDKKIVDIPGFPDGISGEELSSRTYRQAVDALVQFRFNDELFNVIDTDETVKDDPLKRVVAKSGEYLCRKVIIACGLLHFPRRLPVVDALDSKSVFYKVPKIGDYDGRNVVVIGGGDSAFDAAVMAVDRGGQVDVLVREDVPVAKADTVDRVQNTGGRVHTGVEVTAAAYEGGAIALALSNGSRVLADYIVVQIGFLSAKETFQRLDVRLNDDGSIAIDPYFETSRRGIFAVGDVHGDIKLVTVAWAEGIQAAIYAFKEITSPYWLNEKRLRDQKIAMIGDKISQAARVREK